MIYGGFQQPDFYGSHAGFPFPHRSGVRSADPSPQRTVNRIGAMHEMHGGPIDGHNMIDIRNSVIGYSTGSLPPVLPPNHPMAVLDFQQGRQFERQSMQPAHHHHQVMYVCHGHCTGPQCDFSQSSRQWQSMVYLDPSQQGVDGGFRSEVVEMAPFALQKLDKKRASLSQMREILASKLESKQRQRWHRRQRKERGRDRRKSVSSESGIRFEPERSNERNSETMSLTLSLKEHDLSEGECSGCILFFGGRPFSFGTRFRREVFEFGGFFILKKDFFLIL